ncbi:MAG: chloride channel protein [Desulfomonilia bacterium]|nr:chloride channel protein [Desulfomonilia bacterium]
MIEAFGTFKRSEHVFMVVAAILIGILGAAGAILFRFSIRFFQQVFVQTDTPTISFLSALPWWQKILMPVLGGLIVGPIVHFIAREVRGSGIPDVMEAVARKGGMIRPRVVLAKMCAAAVTIGSGGSAGREGPIVQIGSAIGSTIGQVLSVSARRMRTFVACGAAAGIAATFNAPIAGALFSLEVILGDLAVANIGHIVISSVVATLISRHYLGDSPAFVVPEYTFISPYEFIPYTLVGILAGLISVLFIIANYGTQDLFDRIKIPPYLKPALGGFGVGIIALWLPQICGVGYESIDQAIWGQKAWWLLAILIFAKIIATSLTLGSGGSGGIFAPSLFMGAMLGSLVGKEAHLLYPSLTADAGAYALVGMGALVSGTSHAPISAILIIFELTNDYHIIPPLMVACIISLLIAIYFKKESMYTMKLVRQGINIFEGRDINVLKGIRVRDILNTDIEKIPAGCSFSELIRRMIKSHHQEYFLVDASNTLQGIISLKDLKEFFREEANLSTLVIASDIAQPPAVILYPEDGIDLAMHHFGRLNVDELPVVDAQNRGHLIGTVRRMDVIEAYNQEIFRQDMVGGFHSVATAVDKSRVIELSGGYMLMELEPPDGFIDKSIASLNIRNRFGVEVILVRKPENSKGVSSARASAFPGPDYVIRRGDRLLVMGTEQAIQRVKKG